MFKESSVGQVVFYAIMGAVMLILIASVSEKIYLESTRPPGHECKAGETKPQTKENFAGTCENGYWEYFPPGIP